MWSHRVSVTEDAVLEEQCAAATGPEAAHSRIELSPCSLSDHTHSNTTEGCPGDSSRIRQRVSDLPLSRVAGATLAPVFGSEAVNYHCSVYRDAIALQLGVSSTPWGQLYQFQSGQSARDKSPPTQRPTLFPLLCRQATSTVSREVTVNIARSMSSVSELDR